MPDITISAASKNTLVDVIVAALSTTKLRDVGLQALRGVLASDPRLSILDGSVDLQAVWETLEGQPGFEASDAGPTLCYVKTLEDRLGVQIRLPRALGDLPIEEVRLRANRFNPPRAEIERILGGGSGERAKSVVSEPVAVGRRPPTTRRLVGAIAAAILGLGSITFSVVYIFNHMPHTVTFKSLDPGEFSGDIPISSARTWGTEVHATLADASWLKLPEALRRKQLERALDRLLMRRLTTLIVEDEGRQPRATAQLGGGRQPRVFIRFF